MPLVQNVDVATAPTVRGKLSTGVDSPKKLSALSCILLVVPSLVLMPVIFGARLISSDKVDDFTGFEVGARLLGTSKLYDVPANLELQQKLVGKTEPGIIFVRLPFFALAMKPFLALPYRSAVLLWRGLLAAALLAYLFISGYPLRMVAVALCWSIPAVASVAISNDAPLVLLFISLSLACWTKGWRFVAGAFLGLCFGKFHFLIFLPLLLLRPGYRRELAGFASIAVLLVAINFAVQPDWIQLYWAALHLPQPNMNSQARLMPDFYATFFWTGHPAIGVVAGAFLVGAALWVLCRRLSFDIAMPLCIFGGMLVAPHTNYLDAFLAMPALFATLRHFAGTRVVVCFLLSPIAGILCFPLSGLPTIGPAMIVAASVWMLWIVVRDTALQITAPGGNGRLHSF